MKLPLLGVLFFSSILTASSSAWAETAPEWHPGDPIPPGYYVKEERRTDLIIAGSVVFGVGWLGAVVGAAMGSSPLTAIPVAGPWIYAVPALDHGGQMGGTFGILYAVDGVVQAAGLGLLISGLVLSRPVIRSGVKEAKTWWMPTPMSFGNGSIGLGIVGAM